MADSRRRRKPSLRRAETPRPGFPLGRQLNPADALGGSGNYNRTYFGVSPEQSARSGYREHKAKAGIYGYSAGAGWEHQFDENWTTGANLGVTRLTGKAGDSPMVKKKTSATATATVRYNF